MAIRRSRTLVALAVVVSVVALYGALGALVAPPIAKNMLAGNLAERLGRAVSIDEVRFNPYTLDAELKGLRVMEADGKTPFASFDALDVNASWASVRHLAPVVDALTLQGLKVKLVRDAGNHYNFSDIVQRLDAQRSDTRRDKDRPGEPQRFSIGNIRVVNAAVDFDDRPNNAVQRVSDVQIAVPQVSNLPRDVKDPVQPSFSASVNGTRVALTGDAVPFDKTVRTDFILDIRALELPRYLAYLPPDMPVKVDSGKVDARIELRFTQAAGKEPAVQVTGTAALSGLALSNARGPLAKVGRMDIDLASLDPLGGQAKIASLRTVETSAMNGGWKVRSLEARDIDLDFRKSTARVASVATDGGAFVVNRLVDGSIEMPRFSSERAAAPSAKWNVALAKVVLKGYDVTLVDHAVEPAVTHRVNVASVEVGDLSSEDGFKGHAEAKIALAGGGTLDAASTFVLEPLRVKATLDARSIDLVPLRAYVSQFPAVAMKGGLASAKGTLEMADEGGAMKVSYAGSARIDKLATLDTLAREELLDWKSMAVRGVDFKLTPGKPLELAVGDIAVDGMYSRMVVTQEGKLNVQQLISATAEEPKGKETGIVHARNIRIDRITFAGSRLNFTDHYIRPNYNADVGELNGSVTHLSSDPATRATVALAGKWNATSPVVIGGTVNPLAGDLFLDIAAKGEDIDLTKLSAYSARYAGYGITDGRLTLDVKYHVEHGKLEGRNRILVDQLTFGEKVESPEATKLPVLFAVNLLKDKNGRINLVLPISGSLEDPQFDVMAVMSQIFSPMKTAETSPFALLTAGAGDGEDLAYVEFEPGAAALTPRAEAKLAALVKVLDDRPGLKLELAPRIDPAKDVEALKKAALEQRLADAPKDLPKEAREKLAAQPIEIGEQDLTALATQRAELVKAYLCAADRLPAERVVLASAPAKAGEGGKAVLSRVDFALR